MGTRVQWVSIICLHWIDVLRAQKVEKGLYAYLLEGFAQLRTQREQRNAMAV